MGLLIAGIVVYSAYVGVLNRRHLRDARRSPPEQRGGYEGEVSLRGLFEEQRAALDADNLAAIPALVQMIVDPARFRIRTMESISLQDRVIEQHITMEFLLSPELDTGASASGAAREMYIPLLVVRKPALIENLVITAGSGEVLSVLSHEETLKLMSVALHFLVVTCTAGPAPQGSRPAGEPVTLPVQVWQAEALLLKLIHQMGGVADEDIDRDISVAFQMLGLRQAGQTPERATWLHEFVRTLSRAYPVIVAMPRSDARRTVLSYQRTLIPSLDIAGLRGRLRMALGLRPLRVGVDTALAHNSKAYHLRIEGPTSQYLMEQTLTCQVCHGPLARTGVEVPACFTDGQHRQWHKDGFPTAADRPHFELRGKRGQSRAYLYMRGFAKAPQNLMLSASFGEKPPGTLASATITAAVSCLLIGVIGHAESVNADYGSDIPPLLLALPAVAASWFGFNTDSEAILRSSLAARSSLLLGGITSVLAACLFLITKRGGQGPAKLMPPTAFSMHVPGWWFLLFSIATVNTLCVFAQLLVRSWSYRRLLLRKENDGIHSENRLG